MNPRKYKEFIPEVAEEMGVSIELLTDVLELYWKDVRKFLANCESHHIIINGLGSFYVRPWQLPPVKEHYQEIVTKYQQAYDAGQKVTIQRFAMAKEAEKRLAKLNKLEELIEADKIKKKEIKILRNETKPDRPMEE